VTVESKSALRLTARATRAALARACPDIAKRIAAFADAIEAGGIVAGYWPIRDEADPRGLMRALARRGAVLALPRIEGSALSFRRREDGDALVDNQHGIAEPRADAQVVTPDVILVPLLAFDARGHRLGYGGGYYDRTLASLAARAIGVAYSGQEIDAIDAEPHDRRLDAVVTELGVRRFGP
jgi:5-formyltetrahydrofolate cyclo-ligase